MAQLSRKYMAPQVFIKQYYIMKDLEKYVCASKIRKSLKQLSENFKRDFEDDLPYESMQTTLIKYCTKVARPEGDLMALVDKNDLYEPILRMFSVYFKPIKNKECCYW